MSDESIWACSRIQHRFVPLDYPAKSWSYAEGAIPGPALRPKQSMTADEFQSRRSALITLLNQRIGQQNWRLASEVCADLLDIENEWHLSLSIPQPDSAQYQPVVDEMNQRIQPKRNGFDRQHELLASAKEAIGVCETILARMTEETGAPCQPGFEWEPVYRRLKAAVAECEAHP